MHAQAWSPQADPTVILTPSEMKRLQRMWWIPTEGGWISIGMAIWKICLQKNDKCHGPSSNVQFHSE